MPVVLDSTYLTIKTLAFKSVIFPLSVGLKALTVNPSFSITLMDEMVHWALFIFRLSPCLRFFKKSQTTGQSKESIKTHGSIRTIETEPGTTTNANKHDPVENIQKKLIDQDVITAYIGSCHLMYIKPVAQKEVALISPKAGLIVRDPKVPTVCGQGINSETIRPVINSAPAPFTRRLHKTLPLQKSLIAYSNSFNGLRRREKPMIFESGS